MSPTLLVILVLAAEAPAPEALPFDVPMVEASQLEAEISAAPALEPSSPRARSVALELRGWLTKKRTRLLDEGRPTPWVPALFYGLSATAGGLGAYGLATNLNVRNPSVVALTIGGFALNVALCILGSIFIPSVIQAREKYAVEAKTEVDEELSALNATISSDALPESSIGFLRDRRDAVRWDELTLQRTRLVEQQPKVGATNAFLGVGLGLAAASGVGWLILGLATHGGFLVTSGWVTAVFVALPIFLILIVAGAAGIGLTIAGLVRLAKYNGLQNEIDGIDHQLQARWIDPLPRSDSPFTALAVAR
jgi:hypothetical protein